MCSPLPLLFPPDAVSHDRAYPVFPHYNHQVCGYAPRPPPPALLLRARER
jgi:hypothetical protein